MRLHEIKQNENHQYLIKNPDHDRDSIALLRTVHSNCAPCGCSMKLPRPTTVNPHILNR